MVSNSKPVLVSFVCFVIGLGNPTLAQQPPAPGKLVVKEGTEVKLKFSQELSSKTASEGDPVNLVLDEDIRVGDVVVARSGAKASGTVTNAKKAGMMERAANLIFGWITCASAMPKFGCAGVRARKATAKPVRP